MARSTDLRQVSLTILLARWQSKTVRTGGPSGPIHLEWSFGVELSCDEPIRAAAYIETGSSQWSYSQDWGRLAARSQNLHIAFQPRNWVGSDVVDIRAGGIRVQKESAALKADPVAMADLCSPTGAETTGAPIPVLYLPALSVTLNVLAVCSTDTRAANTRWRIRPDLVDGIRAYPFLADGRRGGLSDSPTTD